MLTVADLDVTSLDFGSILRDADKGLVVKPLIKNYLHNVDFREDFVMRFAAGSDVREPDGWFHPSQHPLLPARWLYHYLVNPQGLLAEPMPYGNTLSVMMGKAMHGLVQHVLGPAEAGYLTPKTAGGCWCSHPKCDEWGFSDPECGERGHVDGIGLPLSGGDSEIFEFKTATELSNKVRKAQDMDIDWFRESWPGYWAQQQSYQRMSGRRQSRVVFFTLGYPWDMKEFVIPFDPHFAHEVSEKYRMVRQAAADQRPPSACCGGLKDCAARGLCL